MRFRLVPRSSTLDDLELLYVQIFSEFCATKHVILNIRGLYSIVHAVVLLLLYASCTV